MATVKLMQYEWSDNPREVEYRLPDSWDVTVYNIAGDNKPVLTPGRIQAGIASPANSPRLRELARGKKKACIIFDDMSRGTPVYRIIPAVLGELKEAGIPDSAIEFICALGAHQAWDRSVLARKVGEDIVARYPVYNHDAFVNCCHLGQTSYGTRVEVNAEVMTCDLKIAIGSVGPHPNYGFGGGGKMIMPGVSSYESIFQNHHVTHRGYRDMLRKAADSKGSYEGNPQPHDAIECARMAGLDFSINCILNHKAEVVGIFAGEVEAAYNSAVAVAKEHYAVPDTRDNDIAIANAFCKTNESQHATASAFAAVKRSGGTAVTIANSHLGQIAHFFSGTWGVCTGGRGYRGKALPEWIQHCVLFSEFPEARSIDRWAAEDRPRVHQMSDWEELVARLTEWHGLKARVAVFPDGTNQYVKQP